MKNICSYENMSNGWSKMYYKGLTLCKQCRNNHITGEKSYLYLSEEIEQFPLDFRILGLRWRVGLRNTVSNSKYKIKILRSFLELRGSSEVCFRRIGDLDLEMKDCMCYNRIKKPKEKQRLKRHRKNNLKTILCLSSQEG